MDISRIKANASDELNVKPAAVDAASMKRPVPGVEIAGGSLKRVAGAGQRRLRTETQPTQPNLQKMLAQAPGNDIIKSEEQELGEVLSKYSPKDPNAPGVMKTIYNAAVAGDEKAVRLLIKYKAYKESDKPIILDLALKSKSLSLVRYLVEEEKYVSGKEFYTSIMYNFFDGFDYFRERGYPLPNDIIARSIFGIPHLGSNMARINFLLSREADPTCIQDSPWILNVPINLNDLELMMFLLQHKAYLKVNECSWEHHPLHYAISGNAHPLAVNHEIDKRVQYSRLLADSGMKIDPKFSSQIWTEYLKLTYINNGGITAQKTELLKSLIRAGLSLNSYPSSQESALHYVIREHKDYDLTELMLKMGSDPNQKGLKETPLQTAIKAGNPKIVALLLKYGAKMDDV